MKTKSKLIQFSLLQWVLISIRGVCLIWALGVNYVIQNFLNAIVIVCVNGSRHYSPFKYGNAISAVS